LYIISKDINLGIIESEK